MSYRDGYTDLFMKGTIKCRQKTEGNERCLNSEVTLTVQILTVLYVSQLLILLKVKCAKRIKDFSSGGGFNENYYKTNMFSR